MEMAALRRAIEPLGLEDVWTYIASGNAVFRSDEAPADLEPVIERALAEAFGFEVETFVRTADEVRATVACRPFGALPDGTTHLVAFLRRDPAPEVRAALEALSGATDTLVVAGDEVHWRIEGRSMGSALKPGDWKRAGAGLNTTRNITMLTKLVDRLAT